MWEAMNFFVRLPVAVTLACGSLWAVEHAGVVRSQKLPIPGAVVTATQGESKLATSSDEAGRYRFEEIAAGTWTIEVSMFGFETVSREVVVAKGGGALEWELKLAERERPMGPRGGPRLSQAERRERFRRLAVNQTQQPNTILNELTTMADPTATMTALGQDANESFLVTGSLSQGLQTPGQNDPFGGGVRGFSGLSNQGNPFANRGGEQGGDGAGFGRGGGGRGGPGGGRRAGGRGGGGGRGGPGGRGGGRGGGGRGGPGGPGARGPGGREITPERRAQIREWMRRRGTMQFGNRIGAGRSSMRGALTFSFGNSALDARPYSLTGQTVDKPSYAQGQFGAMLGGPLKIPKIIDDEKTFFFFRYNGSRSRNPFNRTSTLPSELERMGDFSQSIASGPVTLFDAANGSTFPNNVIPASRFDGASLGLLPLIPLPNQPGRVQNYQFITSVPQNSDVLGIRLGRSLSEKDRLSGSYNLRTRDSEAAQLFGFRDTTGARSQSASLGWTHNFTASVINNVNLTYSRNRIETLPFFAFGEDIAGNLGIEGTSNDPVNHGPPNVTFTNFGDLTDGSPTLRRDQTFGIREGITWVRGSHNLSFGGDLRRIQLNTISEQNARGSFSFSGLATSEFDEAGLPLRDTGFDFADFLLGLPQSSSIRFGNPDTYFRSSAYSFYLQDDWRVASNFTVNFGMRYEFLGPFQEKFDRIVNLDVASGFAGVEPVLPGGSGSFTGSFPNALIEPDRNNFAPRLGIAWKPWAQRSTLVRAGYGWYYNGSVYNQAASRLGQQPPFATTGTVTTSLDQVLTVRNGFAVTPDQDITNTFAVDRNYLVGYAQTWNLAVQQDLPGSMVLEVGYLGTKGTRLDIQRSPNQAPPGSPLTAEERRLIGNAVGFTFDSSEGNSIYHAGQVRLNRRFRGGVSFNTLYTFAKSLDNVSTFGGGAAVVALYDRNLNLERGLSSFDQRHTLTVGYVLESPVGGRQGTPSKNMFEMMFRDWTFTGGVTANSGTPFTATVLGNQANSGGSGVVGSGRADATGLAVDSGAGFFNPGAFTTPPADRFGNAARNTIPGPGLFALNFGVGRNFRLGQDRKTLQFRVESSNVTNNVSYTGLGTTVNASNFGLATNTAAMRTMRASLRFRF